MDKAIQLFADYTVLLVHKLNIEVLMANARSDLDKLYEWCLCKKVTINNDKTIFILFQTKNKPAPQDLETLDIGVMSIDRVQSFNYLGISIDKKFNWHEQAETNYKLLLQFQGIFNHIYFYVSGKIAKHLFIHVYFSRIWYGIEVFCACYA